MSIVVPQSHGQEMVVRPRVGVGWQGYSFKVADEVDNSGFIDSDVGYVMLGAGLNTQLGRWFIDLTGQTNLSEAKDENDFDDDQLFLDGTAEREDTVDRHDLNLTLGYAITSGLSLFGGFKYAKTAFEEEVAGEELDANAETEIFSELDIDYFGPFFGASYAFAFADSAFVISGSVAHLRGELDFESQTVETELDADGNVIAIDETDAGSATDGTSIGANIGVAYSGYFWPNIPRVQGPWLSFGGRLFRL